MLASTRKELEDLLFTLTPLASRGGEGNSRFVMHGNDPKEMFPLTTFSDEELSKALQAFGFNALSPHFHPRLLGLLRVATIDTTLTKDEHNLLMVIVMVCLTDGKTDGETIESVQSLLKTLRKVS